MDRRLLTVAGAVASIWLSQSTGGEAQRLSLILALPVQGNVFMLAGPLTNSAVQTGSEGTLLVDTQVQEVSDILAESIARVSPGRIRFIISTSSNDDHTGGNDRLSSMAAVIAHENVRVRMRQRGIPEGRWPSDVYSGTERRVDFNGEAIRIIHPPSAISDGDSFVVFEGSNVVATGDAFTPDRYPRIDLNAGGDIDGLIAALDLLLTLSTSMSTPDRPVAILPGRGPVSDAAGVLEYRDAMALIRDRIQEMVVAGMTLAEATAAMPTSDFDSIYGTRAYPGDAFVETVHRSLTGQGGRPR